jgi:hypothetical protein
MTIRISTLAYAILAFNVLAGGSVAAFAQGEAPNSGAVNTGVGANRLTSPIAPGYHSAAPGGTSSGLSGSMSGPASPAVNSQGTANSGVGNAPMGGAGGEGTGGASGGGGAAGTGR